MKSMFTSRFAQALPNLSTLAYAYQVCFMSKGSYCDMEDLSAIVVNPDNFEYMIHFPNREDGWAKV